MKEYVAHVKNHQSILFEAKNDKDAEERANMLMNEFYGVCELEYIWDCTEERRF